MNVARESYSLDLGRALIDRWKSNHPFKSMELEVIEGTEFIDSFDTDKEKVSDWASRVLLELSKHRGGSSPLDLSYSEIVVVPYRQDNVGRVMIQPLASASEMRRTIRAKLEYAECNIILVLFVVGINHKPRYNGAVYVRTAVGLFGVGDDKTEDSVDIYAR